jgi:hypothetical protein
VRRGCCKTGAGNGELEREVAGVGVDAEPVAAGVDGDGDPGDGTFRSEDEPLGELGGDEGLEKCLNASGEADTLPSPACSPANGARRSRAGCCSSLRGRPSCPSAAWCDVGVTVCTATWSARRGRRVRSGVTGCMTGWRIGCAAECEGHANDRNGEVGCAADCSAECKSRRSVTGCTASCWSPSPGSGNTEEAKPGCCCTEDDSVGRIVPTGVDEGCSPPGLCPSV